MNEPLKTKILKERHNHHKFYKDQIKSKYSEIKSELDEKFGLFILKDTHKLTDKEMDLVKLCFREDGKVSTRKEIALELNRSVATINKHFLSIQKKLNVDNDTELLFILKPYLF